ncbi:MAG: hypothetical protein ACOC5H_02830 [Desulfovermiculus sp.]
MGPKAEESAGQGQDSLAQGPWLEAALLIQKVKWSSGEHETGVNADKVRFQAAGLPYIMQPFPSVMPWQPRQQLNAQV